MTSGHWRPGKSPTIGHRAAQAVCLLALLAPACAGRAQEQPWARLSCDSPAFSVEAPDGWRLDQVPDTGARLLSPDGDLVIEVVAWQALRPPATPEKAARQHEGLLGRAFEYRRRSEEWIITDQGAQGLLVIGTARAQGLEQRAVFWAYAAGDMHYVLGAFCALADLQRLRTSLLDRMATSFRPGLAEVGITPVEPGGTGTGRPPPDVHVEPQPGPVHPEGDEHEPPWAQHEHELGFSLSLPPDWRASVSKGRIVVTPDQAELMGRGVILWPVTGAEAARADAIDRLLSDLPMLAPGLRKLPEDRSTTGAAVVGAMAGDETQLLASYACQGADGFLVVVVAPAQDFDRQRIRLAKVASSFRPGRWMVPASEAVPREVTGELGLLRWRLSPGWQSRGGVTTDGERGAVALEVTEPGDRRLRAAWHQPLEPGFRTLTALLDTLGWREGMQYSGQETGKGMLVYRRRTPLELVHDYLLPRNPRKLSHVQVSCEGLDALAASLLQGPDSQGAVVRVSGDSPIGARERLYLVATAAAPAPLQNTCWEAAELRAEASEGALGEALEALALAVRSAQVTELARDRGVAQVLSELVGRARRSLDAIPTHLLPAADYELPASVLGTADAPDGRLWVLPDPAIEFWRQQAEVAYHAESATAD